LPEAGHHHSWLAVHVASVMSVLHRILNFGNIAESNRRAIGGKPCSM
jgi:hypothetical protein